MGVPVADSAAITNTNALGLTGASAGQFRILGRWPSGNAKWIKVCGILPSLSAGGRGTVTLTDTGSGNFGGADLASGSSPIQVATGAATFTIKQGRFNVIDSAMVGTTQILAPTTAPSRGLVLMGPSPTAAFPANVTCTGTSCSTMYSSANDPASACTIEENGPVMAVVRCTGNHMDANGSPYMQYTVREHFFQNKTAVKVTSILRNANYDTSAVPSPDAAGNTFNTAFKGFQSYELRLSPSLTGALNYSIATDSTAQNGTLDATAGTDSAYIYQGQTQQMTNQYCLYQSGCANTYTTDTGFKVIKNAATLSSGSATQFPRGWADIADASGKGIGIGVYQMAAYWPKSLEFNGGGTDVRIGIWPRQNSQPVYQAWPAWSIHDLFLNFHAARPASAENEFLKFQHFLVARADTNYYNDTNVFPFPMATAAEEDSYYKSAANGTIPALDVSKFCYNTASGCVPDYSINGATLASLATYRNYAWPDSGPQNQEEFRWSNLQVFLKRGFTGRYLDSLHFYRFQAEKALPHADGVSASSPLVNGFTWRSRPHAGQTRAELDGLGQPSVACGGSSNVSPCGRIANGGKSLVAWSTNDPLHAHWYGILDYYFLTGDETIRESVVPIKDYYLNNDSYQGLTKNNGWPTRANGIEMIGAARLAEYLSSLGDTDAAGVLAQGVNQFTNYVKPDFCVSGWPAGCVAPTVEYQSGYDPPGISRVRGLHEGNSNRGQTWCANATGAAPHTYRALTAFQGSILLEGILSLRRAKGPAWSDYGLALDLAYGVSQWALTEGYSDDGQTHWYVGGGTSPIDSLYNGFRFGIVTDVPQVCPAGSAIGNGDSAIGGTIYDARTFAGPTQGMWMHFYLQALMNGKLSADQERKLKIAMAWIASQNPNGRGADWGQYQLGAIISNLVHPSAVLQDVPFTVKDNGGGSYTLTWTVPNEAQGYRIKWSPKIIAPSSGLLNFEPVMTNTFGLDPAKYATWFGANNVTEPQPLAAGASQSVTIATGTTGLGAANFSVKTYAGGTIGSGTGSGTASNGAGVGVAANLAPLGGDGQTGTAGQRLANAFAVRVTDISGNPVAGVPVTFTVLLGGGSLSAAAAATDASGVAATFLTLGTAAGTNTVAAASGTLNGSPVVFTATGTTGSPAATNLVQVSGNGQSGTVGTALSSPFSVKATDASGRVVSGVQVTFTVAAGGGTLSAASVTTDATGIAATVLTLGATAGTNTVLAASGSLAGSPITFTATGASGPSSPSGTTSIVWTRQTATPGWPGFNGYLAIRYEPVSQKTLVYGIRQGSSSIYSTDLFFYDSIANTFTRKDGTGSMANSCPANTATQPSDRHPYAQMAIDTKRNGMWMYGGANQTCDGASVDTNGTSVTWTCCGANLFSTNGSWAGAQVTIGSATYTVASVTDSTHLVLTTSAGTQSGALLKLAPSYIPSGSMYFLQLNANPQAAAWRRVAPAVLPRTLIASAMVYDPENDVLFSFGTDGSGQNHDNWVYCPTDMNPTAGVLTAKQTAAGCSSPDNWNEVTPAGGLQPSGVADPGLIYDPNTKKIIQYGGETGGNVAQNQTWAYDVPTRTWTRKCVSPCVAPPVWNGTVPGSATAKPAMAYIPGTRTMLYHQTSGVGAPADWEYDPMADTWTKLSSSGLGAASVDADMAYDPVKNVLVSWSYRGPVPDIWQGALTAPSSTPAASACDLNRDGIVNSTDVEISKSQVFGTTACSTADLTGDGICNVIDVQRIINATSGGTCRTGQ